MVFSSVVFLFFYLPITLAAYYVAPRKWRNMLLLVVNLFFYGWGEPVYITIMLLSTLIDYTHGMLVEKYRSNDKKARMFVVSSVFFNLLLLVFFKYYDFIVTSVKAVFPGLPLEPLGIPLPIGISFYTFQTMSYTIDVYRGDARAQKNIVNFGTFVTLFPQLIAGPIVQYKDVDDQLRERHENVAQFASGVQTFICGLAKKVLLANSIGMLWDVSLQNAATLSALGAWLGILAYSFQIYFDFSGYSDMAIGLGRMLGFEFKKNFDYPYISRSVTEFWRRWHISLGTWFREYVYIPLGGSRRGQWRTYRNLLIVWALTGIWHGASWNFLFWGLWFAFWLMLEKAFLLRVLKTIPRAVQHIYALFVAVFGWVIFAIEDLSVMRTYVSAMFGGAGLVNSNALYYLRLYGPLLIILVIASTPLPTLLYRRLAEKKIPAWVPVLCAIFLMLSTAYIVDASYNPFLYFRF